jgi:CRISPR/Cas system-associated endonuclease Cas1
MKFDKLDMIASIFEGETCANFNECLSDEIFKQIVKDNASLPAINVANKLIDYANGELI